MTAMMSARCRLAIALVVMSAMACRDHVAPSGPTGSATTTTPQPGLAPLRLLMVTATLGFRHDSISTARQTMSTLAASTGEFTVTATENLADITAARLASTDILMFALTTGELPFDNAQKAAVIAFVENGGGFLGVHSAADTLYDWPDYGRLVGAYFKEHPWTQDANVIVEDRSDPSTNALGASFRLFEEFYVFRANPRPSVHVLLSLDPGSVGTTGDYPLAWSHPLGAGRCYYNALGHFSATWEDARFHRQLSGAIKWLGRRP